MKKFTILLTFFTYLAIFTGMSHADESQKFYIWDDFDMVADGSAVTMNGYTLAASAAETTVFDFDTKRPVGFASLQMRISGSGTLQISHESSIDGLEYANLNGSSDIVTALTAGSAIYQFDLPFARYFKLVFTETGAANSVIIENAVLQVQ